MNPVQVSSSLPFKTHPASALASRDAAALQPLLPGAKAGGFCGAWLGPELRVLGDVKGQLSSSPWLALVTRSSNDELVTRSGIGSFSEQTSSVESSLLSCSTCTGGVFSPPFSAISRKVYVSPLVIEKTISF